MTLGTKQTLFAGLVATLILKGRELGYEVRLGEAWRPPETATIYAKRGIGSRNSLHCDRLAVDLILFKDSQYLTHTEDYAPLGKVWKTLHPLCRWGGDFSTRPDGNHFSLEHDGRA